PSRPSNRWPRRSPSSRSGAVRSPPPSPVAMPSASTPLASPTSCSPISITSCNRLPILPVAPPDDPSAGKPVPVRRHRKAQHWHTSVSLAVAFRSCGSKSALIFSHNPARVVILPDCLNHLFLLNILFYLFLLNGTDFAFIPNAKIGNLRSFLL